MRNYLWVFIEKFSIVLIRIIGIILLARMLTPEDFGIYGMVAIVVSVCAVVIDSGMGGALIKKNNASDLDYSTVFIFNMLTGILLSLIFFNFSEVISKYYRVEEVENVIKVLCISFVIKPLYLIQVVKLTKELKFKLQTQIMIVSYSLSLIVSFYLAYNGFGYWSLIWQQISEAIISSVLFISIVKYYPRLVFSMSSFKDLFSFGSKLMISSIIRTIYDNFIFIILGRYYNPTVVGFYTQAYKINDVFIKTISSIIDKASFPILVKSSLDKDEFLLKSLRLLDFSSFISFFLVITVSLLSHQIIIFALGIEWDNSTWILKILSLAGIGLILESVTRCILKSIGRADLILKLELIKVSFSVLMLILSINFGFRSMLIVFVTLSFLNAIVNMVFIGINTSLSFRKQISCIYKNVLSSLFTYIICSYAFSKASIFIDSSFVELFLFFTAAFVIYLMFSFLFKVNSFLISIKYLKDNFLV